MFDHYPRHDEIAEQLGAWQRQWPSLIAVETIGTSLDGRPLLSATVTDQAHGDHRDKPAVYVEGNIHAGEVLPSVIAMATIEELLKRSAEPDIAMLLRTITFYVRPRVSPDGAEVYLTTPYRLRSAAVPWPTPERQPGLHPEDVNGDGHITLMRQKHPLGEWTVSALDAREMVRADPTDSDDVRYRLMNEGTVVTDGDETMMDNLLPAPTYWGMDYNRSFPHNWQPEYLQEGAGPYPLFPPETRATADFFLSHPNIFAAILHHTSGGFIFTLPSSRPLASYPHDDLTSNYAWLTRQFIELTGNPAFPSYEEETDTARCGSLMDWAYSQQGVLTWVPEHWDVQRAAGVRPERTAPFQSLSESEDVALLRWADGALGEDAFLNWTPFDHPQLGPVEIGGWTFKQTHQNPPPSFIPELARPVIDWTMAVARAAPRVTVDRVAVQSLGGDVWQITVKIVNTGALPTNVCQQAIDVGKAPAVVAAIDVPTSATVLDRPATQVVPHLDGALGATDQPYRGPVNPRRRANVSWLVRAPAGTEVTVTVSGMRSGRDERTVRLGGRPDQE